LHSQTASLLDKYTNRAPQVLLIVGKPGSGVSEIARITAEKIGTVIETVHPKKRNSSGTLDTDIVNGSIIIEDIRQLYERTRSKFNKPHVVIIDFADRTMTHAAQNAFLKLLEEPQPNIYFILATQNTNGLLPTVLSRCQRIDILPLTREQSEKAINEFGITDTVKRSRILFIAEGLYAEIKRLSTDTQYYESRIAIVQDARRILEGSSYERLRSIQSYKDNRVRTLQLVSDILQQLRLSLINSPQLSTSEEIDSFLSAYERIAANGNIQLNLAKVLL
jgi:DNA polymerase-3 subunit delta'